MAFTVFYSWQDDLPNNTNRGFIQGALERAAKDLGKDASIGIEPVIERDTKGIPGAPNIADAIFKKIDACDLFICDVSIINPHSRKFRKTPNPNVLVELGYALKKLGWERLVLVQNTHFGKIETLPFDLKQRRVLPYKASPGADNSEERRRLTEALRSAIAGALSTLSSAPTLEVQLADIRRREGV